MLSYDREITIARAASRKSLNWSNEKLLISEFYEKLKLPSRTDESYEQFMKLPKVKQDELKDSLGGFVGGEIDGPRRKANAVVGRDLVTLDFDNIPAGKTEEILKKLTALEVQHVVYSTRKHCPAAPRLRVIFPTDRTVEPDEYEPLARLMACYIEQDLTWVDPTTFEISRLMYWPTCSRDAAYVYQMSDGKFLDVDNVLSALPDWRDCGCWPRTQNEIDTRQKLASKQADPRTKDGVIGAFCRAHDIHDVIREFLPDVYEQSSQDENRYTYRKGSTSNGVIVYDNKFLFSHHATDPAHGKLLNSFDLIRIHKFGQCDAEADLKTPTPKLPSYLAALEFAGKDQATQLELAAEQFKDVTGSSGQPDLTWTFELRRNSQGVLMADQRNFRLILEHDPRLAGCFAYDNFSQRDMVMKPLPWAKPDEILTEPREVDEADVARLYEYFETTYHIYSTKKNDLALLTYTRENSFHAVQDYLRGLVWDGIPRVETLFIRYLDAEDSPYVRAVARVAMVGAVARVMEKECKFDYMPILYGEQGVGKSTILKMLAKKPAWYCVIYSFEGKDFLENLQGKWFLEVEELSAFKKSDADTIKRQVTSQSDRFRESYGKKSKDHARQCVFFGTTNHKDFLKDNTGNRRFLPIKSERKEISPLIHTELPGVVDQLWAEAFQMWMHGEKLVLTGEAAQTALQMQECVREASTREGPILDYLERLLPKDWLKMTLSERRSWLSNHPDNSLDPQDPNLIKRDRICAREIWFELFDGDEKSFKQSETRIINDILREVKGWESAHQRFGYCGVQRGFIRKMPDTQAQV